MKTFIIAEAGVNHNGSMNTALKLIAAALEAGADAVKFQTFKAEKMVSKSAPKADYQKDATRDGESQYEMLARLELDAEAHWKLTAECRERGIIFLSTPFDFESIELLDGLGLSIFKIPSGEITNLPYLRRVGKLKKKVILSTGMADMDEIGDALGVLTGAGTKKENITVLHCNTAYPTPFEDVNLHAMISIREKFGVKVGYSDHTPGIEVSIAAVALGAVIIEKHFTLDKNMPGPDHKASLEPAELKAMVMAVRNIEKALGDGVKKPTISELSNKTVVRKSIVAARDLRKNEIFDEKCLDIKRPGTGVSPMRWDSVIGRIAKRDFMKDELIEL